MKLAAIYNFFNGEEHLIQSITSVRAACNYICVVAQHRSNSGQPLSREAQHQLALGKSQKLIDEVIWYDPDPNTKPRKNELRKRQIGLDSARKHKCTHFLTIDADEFYRPAELELAKSIIRARNYNSSSVSSFFHVKSVRYRFRDTTNVAFITKLGRFTQLGRGNYPVGNVDSTRKVRQLFTRHHHFDVDIIAMYHMNFVRKDFASKFANTSTTDKGFLENVAQKIKAYDGEPAFDFPRKGRFDLIPATNEFDTYDPLEAPGES